MCEKSSHLRIHQKLRYLLCTYLVSTYQVSTRGCTGCIMCCYPECTRLHYVIAPVCISTRLNYVSVLALSFTSIQHNKCDSSRNSKLHQICLLLRGKYLQNARLFLLSEPEFRDQDVEDDNVLLWNGPRLDVLYGDLQHELLGALDSFHLPDYACNKPDKR